MLKQNGFSDIDVCRKLLPIKLNNSVIERTFRSAEDMRRRRSGFDYPIIAVVTGTKPDFYKQAPLVKESVNQGLPTLLIDTGQHYDDLLGHGLTEFGVEDLVSSNLQIRGDLMEKASELLLKFGTLGRFCKDKFPYGSMLPIVHGDTLVAAITPLSWVFGLGQKVAQNEAGLRSMSPLSIKDIHSSAAEPCLAEVEKFMDSQVQGMKGWFLAREEPFPEQIDTWICSAGTQYFFAPTQLNKRNLVREGYPEEFVHVVGNSVVDAIHLKRKQRADKGIFDVYPELEVTGRKSRQAVGKDGWIRVDIHRRENLTKSRFRSIINGIIELVRAGYKILLIKLTATQHALSNYGFTERLNKLSEEYPHNFIQTPLWKEYGHVIEFLDSGSCWMELTDSGSMQEELLYFPKVVSLTVRLNTDRPETIFDARSNLLVPPINSSWISQSVRLAEAGSLPTEGNKRQIYGEPGHVSKKIINIIKKYFEDRSSFYPWFHQRLPFWKEDEEESLGYL